MVDNTSYCYLHGPEVNTRTVVSQKVRIFSFNSASVQTQEGQGPWPKENDMNQIGMISTFSANESRGVETVRGIGCGDRILEIIPTVTEPVRLDVQRAALWLSNMFQVFGYKSGVDGIIRSLKHHHWPFDIRQELVFSEIKKEPSTDTLKDMSNNDNDFLTTGVIGKGVHASLATNAPNSNNILLTYYEGCWMTGISMSFASSQAIVTENCNIICSDIIAGKQTPNFDSEDYISSNRRRAIRVNDQP